MILFVVESPSDQGIIEGICEQLGIPKKVRIMRGNNPGKACRIIRAELASSVYKKIIVLKDLHSLPERTVRGHLKAIEKSLDNPKIYGIIVRKAIEAWLLADEDLLIKLTGNRCKIKIKVGNLEEIDDPAEVLDSYFKKCGKRYIKSYRLAKNLAKILNLETVKRKVSSFRELLKALKDC